MRVRRIWLKGTSGAGKTTLGRALSRTLGVPFVELDALHHGPNWAEAPVAEFQASVGSALDDERGWVVDGNYDSKLGARFLDRAELVVWLDLPLGLKLVRLTHRTVGRVLKDETLWNGNRESLATAVLGWDALFPWTVRQHFRHRRAWPTELRHPALVRLRSPREVEAWRREFEARERATAAG